MAFEGAQIKFSYPANSDLSAKQFYFVKMVTGAKVDAVTANTDKPVGVLQNAPTAGQAAEICAMGVTKVSGAGALSVGDLIGPSTNGQAEAHVPGTDTTKYIAGQVILAIANVNEFATAVVDCASIGRAA